MRSQAAALGAVLALAAAILTEVPAGGAPARPSARGAAASGDTARAIRVERGPDGSVRAFSAPRDARDPAVDRSTDPRLAARLHLARYDAVLGGGGSSWVGGTASRTVIGDDLVRFRQRRDGLPVIGGAVAVDLRPDRQLASVTASLSQASVPGATYPRVAARREALAVATKRLGAGVPLTVDRPVRRLYDPAVLGVPRTSDPTTHARGVWWVEVHAGPAFHRLVLVDDRSGAVVQDLDLVEQVDRVVCDNHNFNTSLALACKTADAVRTEHGPASTVRDANDAFDLAGTVSTFYRQIGHLNLTRLLGADEGDHKSLSSTVRWCDPGARPADCPLQNAFWNGVGMFYGQGFAGADDVVGHEMTHGVISHSSDLFYWGQSGAINESLADVMGEIVDHRHPSRGDSPHSWALGEDLPIGAIRNMKDPGRFGQPDSMTSRRYIDGPDSEDDNGGVHTNSGVGNRTFYLISQGGKQGGETVRGIDSRSLKKSATLYLDVIQHLVSGSDYADLAAVLDRSCHTLARHHKVGFTRADCRNVHKATLATRLRTTPPRAKQPADAPMTCPKGDGPVRVLFDSETGTPKAKFDAGSSWLRAPNPTVFPAVPANATTGRTSWFSYDPEDTTVSSLVMHPVALPAGRESYLWFQQWRLLDYGPNAHLNYDGGTVEVADQTLGRAPRPAEQLRWVNGPADVITDQFANPAAGRVSFSGDSRGYVGSRLALKRFAGHAVAPQFTMNTDNSVSKFGWYLDDVRVYTCGRAPVPRSVPQVTGTPTVGSTLTATTGRWSPSRAIRTIRWYADDLPITGATGASYQVRAADVGKLLSVQVTARSHGRHASTFSAATAPVAGG